MSQPYLTKDEQELLRLWRALPAIDQAELLNQIRAWISLRRSMLQ